MERAPQPLHTPDGPDYNEFGEFLVETAGRIRSTASDWCETFSIKTREKYDDMTDTSKEIAGWLYESIPKTSDVIDKLKLAYSGKIESLLKSLTEYQAPPENAAALERALEKSHHSVQRKESELTGLESSIDTLQQSKDLLAELAQAPGAPTAANPSDIASIEANIATITDQRDPITAELTELQLKRTEIADMLLNKYDEKLQPFIAKTEQLQTENNTRHFKLEALSIREGQLATQLADLKEKQMQRYAALEQSLTIKPFMLDAVVKALETNIHIIEDYLKKIAAEKKPLAQERQSADAELRKLALLVKKYQKKQTEVLRIRNGEPESEAEPVTAETETSEEAKDLFDFDFTEQNEKIETARWEPQFDFEETAEATTDKPQTCGEYLTAWNTFITSQEKKNITLTEPVDPREFTKEKLLFFDTTTKLNQREFGRLLSLYLKNKGVPKALYVRTVVDFLKDIKGGAKTNT